jgi:phage baseplate assembly protein W
MLALPFRVDESGSIATTSDPNQQLTHRVFSVLATQLGDRVMRPDYGWDFNRFLFEPIGLLDEKRMLTLANQALVNWEAGAQLVGLKVQQTDEAEVRVSLYYQPTGSGTIATGELSFGTNDSGGVFTTVLVEDLSNSNSARG